MACRSSIRAPLLIHSRVVSVRWPSSSVSGSACTAAGVCAEENVSDPALCRMLKVGASGVWQEKYSTVTSYAPEASAIGAEEKVISCSLSKPSSL